MKTKIFKITTLFITLMALAGCMPDSLTKFKKDTVTKPIVSSSTDTVTMPDGDTLYTKDITNISQFFYKNSDNVRQDIFNFKTQTSISLAIHTNGSFGLGSDYKSALFKSCQISPALPFGLSIGQSASEACHIMGQAYDPSHTSGAPIAYTVTLRTVGKDGLELINTVNIQLGFFIEPASISYLQADKVVLTLTGSTVEAFEELALNTDPLEQYTREGIFTSENGTIGIIKSIDPLTFKVGVNKVIPITVDNLANVVTYAGDAQNNADTGLMANPILVCSATGLGKVIRRPSSGNTFYLEVLDNTYFQAGQKIKKGAALCNTFSATDPLITLVNLSQQFNTVNVSNNIQYLSVFAKIADVASTFEIGVLLNTSPRTLPISSPNPSSVSSSGNGVVYSISPDLPTGLSFSTTTGLITGTPQAVTVNSQHTVTATNPIGNSSTLLTLNTVYAPRDLSYSTNQILSLNKISDFTESQITSEIIQPPLDPSQAKKALIINKLDNESATANGRYKLMVHAPNGKFTKSSIFYVPLLQQEFLPRVVASAITPISTTDITTPITANYNLAILVPSMLPAYQVGGYVYSANGALGKVTYKYSTANIAMLYVLSIFEHDSANPVSFNDSDTLCFALTRPTNFATCTTPSAITNLSTNYYSVDIAALNPIGNNFEAVVDTKETAFNIQRETTGSYRIDEMTKVPYEGVATPYPAVVDTKLLSVGDMIELGPDGGSNLGAISGMRALTNTFIVERGVYNEIQPLLSSGSGVTFAVSPALPAGLTLNKSTGLISGTPTQRVNSALYIVSAVNLMKKIDYPLELEVRDYFKVENISKVANSFFHPYGLYKGSRSCKINSNQILTKAYDANVLDVSCFLDIEENDLYGNGLELKPTVGDSICNGLQYEPYSFDYYPPIKTSTATAVEANIGCIPGGGYPSGVTGTPSSAAVCAGDFTELDPEAPNCDEGQYLLTTKTWSLDSGNVCVLTDTSAAVATQCGGRRGACLKGAIRDLLDDNAINNGIRSVLITNAFDGVSNLTYKINSGTTNGDASNLHSANGFIENLCSARATEANAFQSYTSTDTLAKNPFSRNNPYYNFHCKNGAGETKARIRLVVREWDKSFKLSSFIDRDFPDTHLGGGVNALYYNTVVDGFGNSADNRWSWGRYTTTPATACTAPGLDDLVILFPGETL